MIYRTLVILCDVPYCLTELTVLIPKTYSDEQLIEYTHDIFLGHVKRSHNNVQDGTYRILATNLE